MSNSPRYFLKGNLSEKQIEADVASYMGWCTPANVGFPFRLHDIDEQITGADKQFNFGMPIYIQFKKSNGLKSTSLVALSTHKKRHAWEVIREFRASHDLDSDPTLFFQLHAKAKTAVDFQHNILLSFENPPLSRAIYVAPLLLDKSAYGAALFSSSTRASGSPFFYEDHRTIFESHWLSDWAHHLRHIPFLREHISIPPHERVSHHNHFYAYAATGVDISWHSPEIISREPSRLSDFVSMQFGEALRKGSALPDLGMAASGALSLAGQYGFEGTSVNPEDSPLEALKEIGRWLKTVHDIHQIVLLGRNESIRG